MEIYTKVGLWIFLVVSCLSLGSILGNTVTISPKSPTRIEGESLELTCDLNYTSGSLLFLYWYLNSNAGMQRDAATCGKVTTPSGYDESRYNFTCNVSAFTFKLRISNLMLNDSGCWNCSISFSDTAATNRDSTCVSVISSTTTPASTTAATTTAMKTTTTTMSTTHTEMRTTNTEIRTNTETTTNTEKGTVQSIETTSSCPPPVLLVIGVSVSGFLSILLIFIICCCCPCCCLHHCRKKQNTDKCEAALEEANDNEDAKNHTKDKVKTSNSPYVLSDVPSALSTYDKLNEIQHIDGTVNVPIQTNSSTGNKKYTSNKDWEDIPVQNKNEVNESEYL